MAPPCITRVSECFIKPSHNLPPDANQPIHLTPFELVFLTANYSQKGLLFSKPPLHKHLHFSITDFLDDLRRSLSTTLTHFYPLAGRLATRKETNPHSYIIYLDPQKSLGIKFVHATTDVTVSDILTTTDVPLAHSFFDLNNAINHDGHTLPLLSIQVTELVDGIFIGGSINHVVADGTSFWRFMAAWSETFQSNTADFISKSRAFRRTPIEGCDHIVNLPYTHHDQFTERLQSPHDLKERFFNISLYSVSKHKAKANAECNTQKISSLQAVSALLWRSITRARRGQPDTVTVCKLAIGNRHRLNPPLPDDYFGNPVQLVRGTATAGELLANGLGWVALRLHEAVRNHDDTVVRKWVHSWCKSPSIMKMSGVFDPNSVSIGSSPRFNMYGCEFGLGKAVAARSGCANKADGKITMFPGREGGGSMGVEVCLLPEYMMGLECDEEFINGLNGDI
ncbi:putative acetyltransferase At3g50280 [Bidens hawaiensis]|uniref:putative acetyltransferase At3g50280 n=1 Tax=Bidens hawaiensis TaxID=980011 RepID=UPI004049BE39